MIHPWHVTAPKVIPAYRKAATSRRQLLEYLQRRVRSTYYISCRINACSRQLLGNKISRLSARRCHPETTAVLFEFHSDTGRGGTTKNKQPLRNILASYFFFSFFKQIPRVMHQAVKLCGRVMITSSPQYSEGPISPLDPTFPVPVWYIITIELIISLLLLSRLPRSYRA